MANTVEVTASSLDIADCVAELYSSDTPADDISRVVTKPQRTRSKRLRPGDLAIVVKDDSDQLNLGVVVRILSDVGLSWWSQWDAQKNGWGPYRRLKTSHVEALSTRGLSYHSEECDGDLVVRRFGMIPTSYLRRFTG
ncbi:MAG: hypothetical protein LRY53_00910 [Burkholderiaceae bacterium]|nr:hypothetical protein [Burkholderiaceae bacterium]MCD8564239.1 hypothetical protein [Burkholderiaceae bacterium]